MAQISIIRYSELEDNKRIGAETYYRDKLNSLNTLRKIFNNKIIDYFDLVKNSITPEVLSKYNKIKLLELENMGEFQITQIPLVETDKIKSNKYIAQKNDVVISRLRPYLKQVGLVYEDIIYTTTELNILRLKNNKDERLTKFLYFYLCSKFAQSIFLWSQEGTNHPRFPNYILEKLPFGEVSEDLLEYVNVCYEEYINSIYEYALNMHN